MEAWEESKRATVPQEVPPFVPLFSDEQQPSSVMLNGRKLQVIVKMASIVLTPEQPHYSGGVWHVEGMRNESIVATGIYYYSVENITYVVDAFGKGLISHSVMQRVSTCFSDQLSRSRGLRAMRLQRRRGSVRAGQ